MKRGPKPKPIAIHKLEGTFEKSRHGKVREPLAPGALETKAAPAWMNDDQRELWADVLVDAPRDVLRRIDWQLFAAYIELMDRHAKAVVAQRQIDRGRPLPYIAKGAHGVTASPYLRIINHCVILMTRLQSEMGFTPSSRVRLAMDRGGVSPGEAEDDDWSRIYGIRVHPGSDA
jgi:P27 family predicted phage terminase small subunit